MNNSCFRESVMPLKRQTSGISTKNQNFLILRESKLKQDCDLGMLLRDISNPHGR